MDTKELGFLAENIAARHLESKGYRVIERNFRKPWGEIDVIAAKDGALYFVEVKANRQEFIGDFNPEVRVNPEKLSKIIKTAALYMTQETSAPKAEWQVDIISVTFNQSTKKAKIKHFKNVAEDYS
ncbi:MAG: YraN family protein [Patescibacteria group bacterium]